MCGRNFSADRLLKHQQICRKISEKQRPVFDSAKQRLASADGEAAPPVARAAASPSSPSPTKGSKWREERSEFRQMLRANRKGAAAAASEPAVAWVTDSSGAPPARAGADRAASADDGSIEFDGTFALPRVPDRRRDKQPRRARQQPRREAPARAARPAKTTKYPTAGRSVVVRPAVSSSWLSFN